MTIEVLDRRPGITSKERERRRHWIVYFPEDPNFTLEELDGMEIAELVDENFQRLAHIQVDVNWATDRRTWHCYIGNAMLPVLGNHYKGAGYWQRLLENAKQRIEAALGAA